MCEILNFIITPPPPPLPPRAYFESVLDLLAVPRPCSRLSRVVLCIVKNIHFLKVFLKKEKNVYNI